MATYVTIGTNYPYLILGGHLLPDNVISGRFTYGEMLAKNNWEYIAFSTGIHYSAASLLDMWNGTGWEGKTLCAYQWTTPDHHVIKVQWKMNNNFCELEPVIRDETANVNLISGYAMSIYTQLHNIWMQAPGKDGINFGFGRARRYIYATDYEWQHTVMPMLWGDGVIGEPADESNNYTNVFTGAIADSAGTTNQKLLYAAFMSVSIKDPYIGPPNIPKKDPGVHEDKDDIIDFPAIPTDSALITKFLRMYHMDQAGLDALATELWDNNFTSNILKNYDSPFENIIALTILPFSVTGTSTTVFIGNYQSSVSAEMISSQFVDLDGGSVTLPQEWGNQMDYAPMTTCQIFLPFIGYREIDLDDLVGGQLFLKYRVDLLTGNILAMLKVVQNDRYHHEAVEYHFNGNCATSIPVNGANYNNLYSSLMQSITAGAMSATVGNIGGVVGAASSISSAKPAYQRSGNMSGNIGFMSQTQAFLLINRPEQGFDPEVVRVRGIRSEVVSDFGSATGFTVIERWNPKVGLVSITTKEELDEIRRLLKEGVIF